MQAFVKGDVNILINTFKRELHNCCRCEYLDQYIYKRNTSTLIIVIILLCLEAIMGRGQNCRKIWPLNSAFLLFQEGMYSIHGCFVETCEYFQRQEPLILEAFFVHTFFHARRNKASSNDEYCLLLLQAQLIDIILK